MGKHSASGPLTPSNLCSRYLASIRGTRAYRKRPTASDGRFEISAGKDGTARIWRRNGQAVVTLPHKGPVNDAVIDGDTAVTASDDGTAGNWRATDGELLETLKHGFPINALAVSKGVEMIATGGEDGNTRLWSRSHGRLLATLPQGSPVTSVDLAAKTGCRNRRRGRNGQDMESA